jgi:prephenate dehydrogenase
VQSKRFQQTLYAMEKLINAGDSDSLEQKIELASELRANWRISTQKSDRQAPKA